MQGSWRGTPAASRGREEGGPGGQPSAMAVEPITIWHRTGGGLLRARGEAAAWARPYTRDSPSLALLAKLLCELLVRL